MLLAAFGLASCSTSDERPIRVGVLLPLTGAAALHYDEPLDWARDEINRAGGVRGRPIELVYEDIGTIAPGIDAPRQVWERAKRFLGDPGIDVVIGTGDDDTTFGIAPSFITAKKLLISPAASSADVSRAFGTSRFVRRTVATDAAAAELLVLHAKRTGAATVSVLATAARSGSTFFDWVPYHAEELGLGVNMALRIGRGDPDCTTAITQVVSHGAPDVLVLIPEDRTQAECMVRKSRELMPTSRLFMSDPSRLSGLFESLGPLADGVEGITPEAPLEPALGPKFNDAYTARFGHAPPPLAANAFDSLALAAYTLARADGAKGDRLVAAFDEVVQAEGETTAWNGDGIARALRLIDAGGSLPDVTGATGALSFSKRLPLELTSSTFAVWQARGGKTVVSQASYITIDAQRHPFETPPGVTLQSGAAEEDTGYVPAQRKGAWAFVAAMSSTMDNYRHQADALNVYQLLKARGFEDDHIILVLADDIANATTNPQPGTVRNVAAGPNVRAGEVEVDYHLSDVSPGALLDILQGKTSAKTPKVVQSTANDDVFVFWVGHGGSSGVLVGDSAEAGEASRGQFITPFALASAIQAKFDAHAFRQMVFVLDSCHSGAMGTEITTPGVVLLTSATPHENSFATNFDISTNLWNADGFAWALSSHIAASPSSSITGLYAASYLDVRGSHPRMYNAGRFGQASGVTIGSILTP